MYAETQIPRDFTLRRMHVHHVHRLKFVANIFNSPLKSLLTRCRLLFCLDTPHKLSMCSLPHAEKGNRENKRAKQMEHSLLSIFILVQCNAALSSRFPLFWTKSVKIQSESKKSFNLHSRHHQDYLE